VNNPEQINDELVQEHLDESRLQDEVMEIQTEKLEQVSGGGNGTVYAYP
jgi:hypothetical protein